MAAKLSPTFNPVKKNGLVQGGLSGAAIQGHSADLVRGILRLQDMVYFTTFIGLMVAIASWHWNQEMELMGRISWVMGAMLTLAYHSYKSAPRIFQVGLYGPGDLGSF